VTAPVGGFTEAGVAGAEILVEGLRRAGKNPTRAGLIKALETLHNWNGSLAPSLTYTATSHAGEQGVYMTRAHKGTFVQVTGYSFP
jgi:branched-chain amino acid transport system substrate-binding protein